MDMGVVMVMMGVIMGVIHMLVMMGVVAGTDLPGMIVHRFDARMACGLAEVDHL
jgi:hypothetical protein